MSSSLSASKVKVAIGAAAVAGALLAAALVHVLPCPWPLKARAKKGAFSRRRGGARRAATLTAAPLSRSLHLGRVPQDHARLARRL